jgi:transcription elongation factor Elf1
MDSKRKGKQLYCKICGKKTRHLPEVDKEEKMSWWICEDCGFNELFDHWS